jgi:hypothetical protein
MLRSSITIKRARRNKPISQQKGERKILFNTYLYRIFEGYEMVWMHHKQVSSNGSTLARVCLKISLTESSCQTVTDTNRYCK